jgi:hypothetical protein
VVNRSSILDSCIIKRDKKRGLVRPLLVLIIDLYKDRLMMKPMMCSDLMKSEL